MNGYVKLALVVLLCFQHSLFAATTKRWDGSASGNWSNGANWEGGSAPQNGDVLHFPGGVTRRTVTNDIANFTASELLFEGTDASNYVIRGQALRVTGLSFGPSVNSQSTGSNRMEIDVVFDNAFRDDASFIAPSGSLTMTGDFTITRRTLLRGGVLHFSGAITGTGDIEFQGEVLFDGSSPNDYLGTNFVTSGILKLNKRRFNGIQTVGVTAIPDDLRIGEGSGTDSVQLLFNDQIANTANVMLLMNAPLPANFAKLDLNGFDDTIGSITIGGGIIEGNGGLLTLNGNIDTRSSSLISTIATDLNLPSGTHTIAVSNAVEIVGAISGTGDIVKVGPAAVAFGGSTDNTFTGTTTVNEGVLQLSKTNAFAFGVDAPLVIGQNNAASPSDIVRHLRNNQLHVANPITINSSGVLDLNNFVDDIGSLTLNGGTVQSGPNGTNQLRGSVTAVSVSHGLNVDQAMITGNLDLGANNRTFTVNNDFFLNGTPVDLTISANISGTGGIIKTGPGELVLTGNSSFTGTVTVNQGELIVGSDTALGATANGTTVNNDARLTLDDALVVGEVLTLNSSASEPGALRGGGTTNLWTGLIALAQVTHISVDTGAALNLQCLIGGNGGLEKEGDGLLKFSGASANSYNGVTVVKAGTLFCDKTATDGSIPGDLVIGDGLGGADADLVFYSLTQINNSSRVTITESGKLLVGADTIGSLSGTGKVEVLNTGELRTGANNDSTTYTGLIIGGGGITKQGTGAFTLTRNNTYTGTTIVQAGTLFVNGSQSGSDVTVNLDAILAGRGSIGDLQVNGGGIVSPGASTARLNARNTVFGNEGALIVELNGPAPGSEYDQLGVVGTVDVTSADLQVSLNHAPLDGHVFTIVDNNGTDAVVGTFDLLPNNSIITLNQIPLRLNYNGGTGNDITLTVTNLPLHAARASIATGDRNGRIDVNECNELFLAITNSTGSSLSGVNATLTTTTPNVFVTENQSAYPTIPGGGVRTNSVPFQFFTTPDFPCGADITFILTVTTPANGTFRLSYVLPTGLLQPPVTFSNNAAVPIPDGSSTASPITVSGLSGGIAEVTLSLFLTHNGLANLQVFLVSPDGATLPMVIGAAGTSLGTNCNAVGRMVLDDDATRTIAGGPAPYVGAFKPLAPLSLFDGKSGAALNGTWLLRIIDPIPDALVGSLSCWSLTITPATCTDGGGICAPCNGPFIGSVTTNDLKSTRVLLPMSGPSVCASSGGSACLTAIRTGFYDAFTFTNAGPDNTCVTVTLSTPCGTNQNALYSAAFLGQFNPTNPCPTRIGFMGPLPDPDGSYGFLIASNGVFTVIVSSVNPGFTGCSNYVLSVDGFQCPVELGFGRTSTGFVINWPTHAVGFVPERNTNLATSNWTAITNEPTSGDGKLVITNNINVPRAFYRLRRP